MLLLVCGRSSQHHQQLQHHLEHRVCRSAAALQICRLRGYSPIVAVVGGAHKVASARALGADVVVDKAACTSPAYLWRAIEQASPAGYAAIFDANGVETLQVCGWGVRE